MLSKFVFLKYYFSKIFLKKDKNFFLKIPAEKLFFTFEKKDLHVHIEGVHEGKRPYKCSICIKFYKSIEQLKDLEFKTFIIGRNLQLRKF